MKKEDCPPKKRASGHLTAPFAHSVAGSAQGDKGQGLVCTNSFFIELKLFILTYPDTGLESLRPHRKLAARQFDFPPWPANLVPLNGTRLAGRGTGNPIAQTIFFLL